MWSIEGGEIMYNKKYRLTNIITETYNPIHEDLTDKICYLAYFNVGERGWFLYQPNSWFDTFCPN